FCRRGFGSGLLGRGPFRLGLGGVRRFGIVGRRLFGRRADDLVGLVLVGRVLRDFLRTCRRLALGGRRLALGWRRLGVGLRRSLLLLLVIADRDDLQYCVLLAMALLATVIVAPALLEHRD